MLSLFSRYQDLKPQDVAKAREYIKKYQKKLIAYNPQDGESLIGLPNKYLVPATEEHHEHEFNEMYYWDSYFNIQHILDDDHKELVMGMLDNLIYMFEKFKIIPNASRTYLMGRSQPPLLTSFIWDVYQAYDLGTKWLGEKLAVAMDEYQVVWMGTKKPNHRQVHMGLSRFYEINALHDLAETESGWDMTPRFGRKCLNFLPVDLNALLYKYETDFARYYRLVDNKREAAKWEIAAKHRKEAMDKLMWSDLKGLYYDYNFVKKQRGTVSSMAGLYPLWAGMVSEKRAKQMVKAMRRFENRGGLAATDVQNLNIKRPGAMPTQWAYPNGWAPLHFLAVVGLERYGYKSEAKTVAMKWLRTNLRWFETHGLFMERYNVVNVDKPPAKGLYPSPTGFGWTNAVFERFCQMYIDAKQ